MADETTALTREELRARYGTMERADTAVVLALLGRSDIDPARAFAFRYPSVEACRAFALANLLHHGHDSLGPFENDLGVFGVVLLAPEIAEARHG